jgi:hypothetical protein
VLVPDPDAPLEFCGQCAVYHLVIVPRAPAALPLWASGHAEMTCLGAHSDDAQRKANEQRKRGMHALIHFLTYAVAAVMCGSKAGLLLGYSQASLTAMPLWVQGGGTGLWGLAIAGALHPRPRGERVWLLTRLGSLCALHVLTVASLPVFATVFGTWTPGTLLTTVALQKHATGDPAFDRLSAHRGTLAGWGITYAPLLFGACAVGMVLCTLRMGASPSSPTPPEEDAPC